MIRFPIAIGLTVVFLGFLVNSFFLYQEYETKIGSYIENAYEVNTPERMVEQVKLAKEAMLKEGLSPETYGAMFFKRPDSVMSWQYDFIDSVTERANAVIKWKSEMERTGSVETLGDVYETKMDNLREFLKENGRADWIAQDAWYIENHPIMYLFQLFFILFVIVIIIAWSVAIALTDQL